MSDLIAMPRQYIGVRDSAVTVLMANVTRTVSSGGSYANMTMIASILLRCCYGAMPEDQNSQHRRTGFQNSIAQEQLWW
jgi:hypothetical protein